MRKIILPVVERARAIESEWGSSAIDGNNGKFLFLHGGMKMCVIASDGLGWDHVSVSYAHRCPTWEEMTKIKDLFWNEDEAVFQFHPAKEHHRDYHKYCLHLWKPQDQEIPMPLPIMVAPEGGCNAR